MGFLFCLFGLVFWMLLLIGCFLEAYFSILNMKESPGRWLIEYLDF